jgi:hypothetical protein
MTPYDTCGLQPACVRPDKLLNLPVRQALLYLATLQLLLYSSLAKTDFKPLSLPCAEGCEQRGNCNTEVRLGLISLWVLMCGRQRHERCCARRLQRATTSAASAPAQPPLPLPTHSLAGVTVPSAGVARPAAPSCSR